MSLHWSEKVARVNAAISARKTIGPTKLASVPYVVEPLLLAPRGIPLRGPAVKDWRIELLFKPADLPTPARRKRMREVFGEPVCGIRRETQNPNNPLARSVDGWWWHGGCWMSAELAEASLPPSFGLGPILGAQLSVWLESAAERAALVRLA